MNLPNQHTAILALAITLFGCFAAQAAKAVAATPTAVKDQNPIQIVSVPEVPIPKSVFTVPANAREGRNPFFPESLENRPAPDKTEPVGLDKNAIVVNGITSPPRATVMLNGKTFEQGETGDVKLKDGTRVAAQVVEIKTNSVIVVLAGQRRELKLRGI